MNKFKLTHSYTLLFISLSYKLQAYICNEINNKYIVGKNYVLTSTYIKIDKGYKWDGCSPKWKIGKYIIGTPDGKINKQDNLPKLYYPSLIHDVLYDSFEKHGLTRKICDLLFYELAKEYDFHFAKIYYIFVQILGGVYHKLRKKRIA